MTLEMENILLYRDWGFTFPKTVNIPLHTTTGYTACAIRLVPLAGKFVGFFFKFMKIAIVMKKINLTKARKLGTVQMFAFRFWKCYTFIFVARHIIYGNWICLRCCPARREPMRRSPGKRTASPAFSRANAELMLKPPSPIWGVFPIGGEGKDSGETS